MRSEEEIRKEFAKAKEDFKGLPNQLNKAWMYALKWVLNEED